jgi:hypothetical protein
MVVANVPVSVIVSLVTWVAIVAEPSREHRRTGAVGKRAVSTQFGVRRTPGLVPCVGFGSIRVLLGCDGIVVVEGG